MRQAVRSSQVALTCVALGIMVASSPSCSSEGLANEPCADTIVTDANQSAREDIAVALLEALDSRPYDGAATAALLASNYTNHDRSPQSPAELTDQEDILATYEMLAAAFPDGVHEVEFVESMADCRVSMRWRFQGTHEGPLFGIPASGQPVDIHGMEVFTINDGQIIDQWHVQEIATLLQQVAGPDE